MKEREKKTSLYQIIQVTINAITPNNFLLKVFQKFNTFFGKLLEKKSIF